MAEELDIKILNDLSEIYPKIKKLSEQYYKDVDVVYVEKYNKFIATCIIQY